MKKFTFFILFLAAAVLLWAWYSGHLVLASAPSVPASEEELVAVRRGDISVEVLASAIITPEHKLEIKPPLAGRAESVLVDIGQEVKRGQTLAMMSSSERAALLDAARAKGPKESAFWEDIYKPAPLVAPLDGVIISRTLVPGQVVTTTDVAFIMSDHLIAQASMDETDLAKVFLGQEAIVTLDSYPDQPIKGKVSKIAYNGVTTSNVTTYAVDVTMEKVPEFARSGMTASVGFLMEHKKQVLLLPVDAVTKDEEVFLPSTISDQEPRARKVTTGLSDGKNIEITSGLSEGERVFRSTYRLPEKKSYDGFSLLPRPKQVRGNATPKPSPPPPPEP